MYAGNPFPPTPPDPVATDIKGSFGGVGDPDTMIFGAVTRAGFFVLAALVGLELLAWAF